MEYPGISGAVQADVIVTAGGTREQIDDVRYIGNFSGGHLGHSMARDFSSYGRSVRLLTPGSVIDRYGPIAQVEHEYFDSCASLNERIKQLRLAKIVVHAAAVSDYTPIREPGKISSDQEALTIRLQRTPKILSSLREHFGNQSYLVGFKLLSDVSQDELIATGRRQIITNRTDMCIANDLQEINRANGHRKVYAINGHNGSVQKIEGSTHTVARHLTSIICLAQQQRASNHA